MTDPLDLVFYDFYGFCQAKSSLSSSGSQPFDHTLEIGSETIDTIWLDVSSFSPQWSRARRGQGPESISKRPDRYDGYRYREWSISHARLIGLGYLKVSLISVVKICNMIESALTDAGVIISVRNRAAKRRMTCAFHWLDENWGVIGSQAFDIAAISVLGQPSGPVLVRRLPGAPATVTAALVGQD
jgi:hypothetical protein